MKNKDIKKELTNHGLYIWQLCKQLGISRSTYYKYWHRDFKGHKQQIKDGIKSLIRKDDVKNAD